MCSLGLLGFGFWVVVCIEFGYVSMLWLCLVLYCAWVSIMVIFISVSCVVAFCRCWSVSVVVGWSVIVGWFDVGCVAAGFSFMLMSIGFCWLLLVSFGLG